MRYLGDRLRAHGTLDAYFPARWKSSLRRG